MTTRSPPEVQKKTRVRHKMLSFLHFFFQFLQKQLIQNARTRFSDLPFLCSPHKPLTRIITQYTEYYVYASLLYSVHSTSTIRTTSDLSLPFLYPVTDYGTRIYLGNQFEKYIPIFYSRCLFCHFLLI